MISASLRIDSRCPPKFTPDDNADIIQHPTFIQIGDQCVDGLIQSGTVMADETFVIPVTVPSTVGQCDTANTDFDKSPRHQNQFVVRGGTIVLELERFTVAVSRADRRGFFGDV